MKQHIDSFLFYSVMVLRVAVLESTPAVVGRKNIDYRDKYPWTLTLCNLGQFKVNSETCRVKQKSLKAVHPLMICVTQS